jgi:hypothetical protein
MMENEDDDLGQPFLINDAKRKGMHSHCPTVQEKF